MTCFLCWLLCSSRPWYVVFIFAIPLQVEILQLHFHDSSPFQTHPINMWSFVFAILLCCVALAYYIKCRLTGSICFMNICDKIGYISGLLASAAFISVLVPPSIEPFVFVIWIVISIMFIDIIRNWILKVAQKIYYFVKNGVSYIHNIWKLIIGNNDNIEATVELV